MILREVFDPADRARDDLRAAERDRQQRAPLKIDPELERFRGIWPSIGREVSLPRPRPEREYNPYRR